MYTAELTIMDLDTGTPEEAVRSLIACAAGAARPLFVNVTNQHTKQTHHIEVTEDIDPVAPQNVAPVDVYQILKRYKDSDRFSWEYVSAMCREISELTKAEGRANG